MCLCLHLAFKLLSLKT